MQKVIKIQNLDCANCAAELSEELNAIAGISGAVADVVTQRVSLEYADGRRYRAGRKLVQVHFGGLPPEDPVRPAAGGAVRAAHR